MRKTITLDEKEWLAVSNFRFAEKLNSQAEAIRILLAKGLIQANYQASLKRAERRKGKE